MKELAKQIFSELCPANPESFSKIPEERMWLLILLRMGMDLYVAAGREENTLVINELKSWASEIPGVSTSQLTNLEQHSKSSLLHEEQLPNLMESSGLLIATALVELALKDARIDANELQYLKSIFSKLSVWDAPYHQHWLMGELPEDNCILDSLLLEQSERDDTARRIANHLLQKAKTHRKNPKENLRLLHKMYGVRRSLEALREDALRMGSDFVRILDGASKEIEHLDHLRIAVLGEFKRGKSTFINALLRKPGFMPTDELPCTSAITEIRLGAKERYIEMDTASGRLTERTRDDFLRLTGDADRRGRKRARSQANDSDETPDPISRWEVSVPSSFFDNPAQLTLIDTPGLNEDPIRDFLAKQEARTSHAAVLVLSADQLLSNHEQELVEEMGENKIRGLIVVINRADLVSQERWGVMKERVLDLLGPRGLKEKQIVFSNAFGAEEATRKNKSDEWLQLFHQAEERIHEILIENATPIRMTMLEAILDAKHREVRLYVNKQTEFIGQKEVEIEGVAAEMSVQKERCELSIQKAQGALEQGGKQIAQKVVQHLKGDWRGILEQLELKKDDWDTSKNPLFSPKKAATEMAKRAQKDLSDLLQEWVLREFQEFIQVEFQKLLEQTKQTLKQVAGYIEDAKGLSSDEVIDKIFRQATTSAFGKNIDLGDAGGTIASVLTATVAMIIGYIIADIILYYALSVISGFLNPFLLAGAAVVGLAAILTGGPPIVKNYMRKQIAKKLRKELSKDSVLYDLSMGVESRVNEVFAKFAETVASEAQSYVSEAESQWLQIVERSQATKEEKEAFLAQADTFLHKMESLAAH